MSKLKDINLSDLGIKNKNIESLINSSKSEMELGNFLYDSELSSSPAFERKMSMSKRMAMHDEPYYLEEKVNNPSPMNNKFLKYVNIIENIKNKPGVYLDKRAEWEKDLEPAEFTLPPKPSEKTIPLTFRKFFYQTFSKNITEFALKKPEELPGLIAGIRSGIQKDAQRWLDFIADKQISTLLCQIDNYSEKGKIYKKSSEFQNIPQVIQWIIDTNTKLRYESADWNKDGEKTFTQEKEAILIIDTTLHKEIEIKTEKGKDDLNRFFSWKNSKNPPEFPSIFPLPLYRIREHFASVITFPLKNNFQFIIIDKRALVGWKDFQKLEIKYDEVNSITYFCRKMEGGFKQLTYYNAVAFISE